jgi:hypothetical protein
MQVTINQAMALTGKSRSTIDRYIKLGKLSKTDKGIDTSELMRVFGELKQGSNSSVVGHDFNLVNEREIFFINQIKQLQQDNKDLKAEFIEREKRLISLLENYFGSGLFGKNI